MWVLAGVAAAVGLIALGYSIYSLLHNAPLCVCNQQDCGEGCVRRW